MQSITFSLGQQAKDSSPCSPPPQDNQERHLFETLGSSGVRLSALAVALDLRALAVLL